MSSAIRVRSRTFCCCLPVRFGVFILTILGMAGGTLLAVVGWLQTIRMRAYLLDLIYDSELLISFKHRGNASKDE
jgi:hypothetical protein